MRVGDRVQVMKYGAWYRGLVVKVTATKVHVQFTTKGGATKVQPFDRFDRYSVKAV